MPFAHSATLIPNRTSAKAYVSRPSRSDARSLSKGILDRVLPGSRLSGAANLLVMPSLDAANITFNALKVVSGEGVTVGPILLGASKPAHILTPTSTVRRIVNMTALAAVGAANAA